MKVIVTVTREYEMNEERILSNPSFAPPPEDAPDTEKRAWLEESFYELCGFDRDKDHLDGRYVWNTEGYGDTEFVWPEELP